MFNKIQIKQPKRNKFDLSHDRKMSMRMGDIVPILLQEVVPGDSFRVNSEVFIRLAPMLAPIMHRVNVYTHYFFVPNRIIWDNWKTFITGGEDGLQTAVYPTLNLGADNAQFDKGSLSDYFGMPIPPQGAAHPFPEKISALPFRAYQEIYNEYYRDQNLTQKVDFSKGDETTGNVTALTTMRKRAWEKDYFTSALPWPQRGADVNLPVEFNYKDQSNIFDTAGAAVTGDVDAATGVLRANLNSARIENLEEDATSVTINELRIATRLQEWLEKNARGGSRYIEQILSHFGVRSSDARLQRPEYLGGGKSPVIISEVLNKAGDLDAGTNLQPVGDMAGHGISVGRTNTFKKSFEEHGYILGMISVLPRTAYSQGIPRHMQKFDKLDYYWPEFAHLGEQEVLDKEIYFDPTTDTNQGTFGYQTRYAEYKYQQSSIHGDFRDTLDYWQMGREFDNRPQLNTEFVQSDPTERIFAVDDLGDTDKLYVQIFNRVSAIRPMPYFGTPYL